MNIHFKQCMFIKLEQKVPKFYLLCMLLNNAYPRPSRLARRFRCGGTVPKTTKQKSNKQDLIRPGRPHTDNSRPPGPSPKVQASVSVHDRERLRAAAQTAGISETDLVRRALSYFLNQIEQKKITLI